MRVSGVLVLFLALGHLYIMHVANSIDVIDDAFVRSRLASPWWKTYDILLLALAFSHGSIGVKNVLEDVIGHPLLLKIIKIFFGLFCLAVALLGLAVFVKDF